MSLASILTTLGLIWSVTFLVAGLVVAGNWERPARKAPGVYPGRDKA